MSGRYQLGELFAEGAQARLYEAFDSVTGKRCILKAGGSVVEEGLLAIELNHPYIARPFDIGKHQQIGKFCAYPEFKQPSFLEWMRSQPVELDVHRVGMQLAEFLSYLHSRGFLYNDFKPEHFLIGPEQITVLDLGLCTRFADHESGTTFSGTFPYISPERVTGREADARSDIFAAGILFLHGFLPEDNWNYEPSLSALQKVQGRWKSLKGFWRELLSEMTALEPGQRIGSAAELWKRLCPDSNSEAFLFFQCPPHFSIQELMKERTNVTWVRSGSGLTLKEAERQVLYDAWKADARTVEFDFRFQSVQRTFQLLAEIMIGAEPLNFYVSLEQLRALSGVPQHLILLKNGDLLSDEDRCLLQFALSTLSGSSCFRFFLPVTCLKEAVNQDEWRRIDLPTITKEKRETILQLIFPRSGSPEGRINQLLKKRFSMPEQILWDLRQQLPRSDRRFWPSAALMPAGGKTVDGLNAAEKKCLFILALSEGTIRRSMLIAAFKRNEKDSAEILSSLQADGFLYELHENVYLTFPADSVLSRLRKSQIRQMSQRALEAWGEDAMQNPAVAYEISKKAEKLRFAAFSALKLSRASKQTGNNEEAHQWLVNAFLCGATIPRLTLYRMAIYEMRRARMQNARKIIQHLKMRFGSSYRLADLKLDYLHRKDSLAAAVQTAARAANRAKKNGRDEMNSYFLARQADMLLVHQAVDKADAILVELSRKDLKLSTRALVNLQLGISCFYHGRMPEALGFLQSALRQKHRFRSKVLMALGAAHGRMGRFKESQRWLLHAARILTLQQDAQRLSIVCNNLGNVCRRTQDFPGSRQYYYRSLYLSRIGRNTRDYLSCMNSLANSHEDEGRTDRAIEYHEKAIRISQKPGLRYYLAMSLTNLGLQYAIRGQFKKANETLRKAITIRKELSTPINLAASYEYLGICNYLSGRPAQALRYLKIAGDAFHKSSCFNDHCRTELLRAICFVQDKQQVKAREILSYEFSMEENSFEKGIYFYAVACLELASEQWDPEVCRDGIHQSERILRKLPSLLWLAQLYHLKIEYSYRTDHYEKALLFLENAFNLFSRLGARRELLKLEKWGQKMKMSADFLDKMAEKLPYKVLVMLKNVLATKDPDSMVSAILTTALEFTDMDRAVLILQEEPPRIYKSAAMEVGAVQEIYEISKSAMESVSDSGKPFLCFDASSHPYIKAKPSIISNQIMSIVCLPLNASDKVIGLLYLDSKEGVESLTKTENLLLEIFASIISLALSRALDLQKSMDENKYLRDTAEWTKVFPEIIGKSKAITDIFKTLHRLLDNELPVLIYGETGTGKELIARVLHYCGKRKNGSFIAVNCSAFSTELMESELFGHEKGAFTGAANLKRGLFEEAQNGTLFLDEISELPFSMQAKLLRVLQGGEFRRVGGTQTLRSNTRVVLATNKDLSKMVKEKEFREDLYYRIRGVQVHVPSLRERREDIPLLANEFLKEAMLAAHKQIHGFTPEARNVLKQYSWPGNVRQLKLEIEKIVALTENEWISAEDLDPQILESGTLAAGWSGNGGGSLQEIEKEIILERLKTYQGNIIQAARSLGISRHGLYSKMRRHQIPIQSKD